MTSPCASCGGSGKLRTPCKTCGGAGKVRTEQPLTVRIPKGAADGSHLRVRDDLVIETRVRPHPHFRREGLDLHLRLPIRLDEALDGAQIDVPTVDGSVKLRVPPRSQPGTRLRLRGKGVRRGDEQGDLYVELSLRLPDQVDEPLAVAAREATYAKPVREEIRL